MRVGVSASLALERAARGRRSFLVLRFGERSYAAHCCLGKGFCGALSSYVSVLLSRRVLAPLVPDAAAMWQPPAAKEGQGDCEFPLLPPWILFSPLCTAAAPLGDGGGGARRSYAALRLVAKGGCVALRSTVALRLSRQRSCAAYGCGSSLVAASGGQGGIGVLRFPPRPSLDSPITP